MMKRVLSVAILVTMFAVSSVSAADLPNKKYYEDAAKALKDDAKVNAEEAIAHVDKAWNQLEGIKKAELTDEFTKEDKAKEQKSAQEAYDKALAELNKLIAAPQTTLQKVEGYLTLPVRKCGELLSSKWGSRVATGAGLGVVGYVVYDNLIAEDDMEDEDATRAWL